MTKKLPCTHACRDIVAIPGTKYIILPDQTVARLLKPTLASGKTYYNLMMNDKLQSISVEKLVEQFKPSAE